MSSNKPARRARVGLAAIVAVVASTLTITTVNPAAAANPVGAHHRATLAFKLSGSQVPGGGDPDGKGSAVLRLHPAKGVVCFKVRWSRLDGEVTAMHIHAAPAGQVGGHHIDLFNDEHFVGERNRVEACVRVASHDPAHSPRELIQDVIDDPEDFYLNVHSTAFPPGAIRGQLP
jgi:hypothetical protein